MGSKLSTIADSIAVKPAPLGKIGVCALDGKARSKPSRNILTRLQNNGEFDVIVFGDKVILDEGEPDQKLRIRSSAKSTFKPWKIGLSGASKGLHRPVP